MSIQIGNQPSTFTTRDGKEVVKYRLRRNDKHLLVKASDSYVFAPRDSKSSCMITKDVSFINAINKICERIYLDQELPVKRPFVLKDQSTDQFVCFPYWSPYAKLNIDNVVSYSNEMNLKHNISGDVLLRITDFTIKDGSIYLNMAYYSIKGTQAIVNSVDIDSFVNEF